MWGRHKFQFSCWFPLLHINFLLSLVTVGCDLTVLYFTGHCIGLQVNAICKSYGFAVHGLHTLALAVSTAVPLPFSDLQPVICDSKTALLHINIDVISSCQHRRLEYLIYLPVTDVIKNDASRNRTATSFFIVTTLQDIFTGLHIGLSVTLIQRKNVN